jgi:hypothetical protein
VLQFRRASDYVKVASKPDATARSIFIKTQHSFAHEHSYCICRVQQGGRILAGLGRHRNPSSKWSPRALLVEKA